jgi:hypothetical protein
MRRSELIGGDVRISRMKSSFLTALGFAGLACAVFAAYYLFWLTTADFGGPLSGLSLPALVATPAFAAIILAFAVALAVSLGLG